MALFFGDLALDQERRQLLRSGQPVRLEPKAFELLSLLLTRRPRALSKSQIRYALWPGISVSESALARLVNQLRAACGDDAREPRFVRTVHGFGYAFCGAVQPSAGPKGAHTTGPRFRLQWKDHEVALADGENILGRVDEAAAWIESAGVSRRHACIRISGGKATLEDLGSKNGTFLNGRRLNAPATLTDGDGFRLGTMPMMFRVLTGVMSTKTGGKP
jgi:DNA-binding winged helix-turn-helix (wHTH) protein